MMRNRDHAPSPRQSSASRKKFAQSIFSGGKDHDQRRKTCLCYTARQPRRSTVHKGPAWSATARGPVGMSKALDVGSVDRPHSVQGLGTMPLLTNWKMGKYNLDHRVVYAPLTRDRGTGQVAQPAAAIYYSQRATQGGFMLTEATCISQQGQGYPDVPGIHTEEQMEAWKPIVQAVHKKGAVFFLQLWHVGRASHPDYQPGHADPVSSSPGKCEKGQVFLPGGGAADYPPARALDKSELPGIAEDYAHAARNAIAAGFDGVEIHSANSYLLDQFLKDTVNKRTDEYGGSIENRCRFPLQVVEAVCKAVGSDRVGIRLSPFSEFMEPVSSDAREMYTYLATQLSHFNLCYLHCVEARVGTLETMMGENGEEKLETSLQPLRKAFKGSFLAAGGYDRDSGNTAIKMGHADGVVYGRWFLANPDLPARFALDKPLNMYDRDTFYVNEQVKGYTDYPTLQEVPQDAKVKDHRGVPVYA